MQNDEEGKMVVVVGSRAHMEAESVVTVKEWCIIFSFIFCTLAILFPNTSNAWISPSRLALCSRCAGHSGIKKSGHNFCKKF